MTQLATNDQHYSTRMPGQQLAEKKRKDYAFRRQFNEKPNIILGCPEQLAQKPIL